MKTMQLEMFPETASVADQRPSPDYSAAFEFTGKSGQRYLVAQLTCPVGRVTALGFLPVGSLTSDRERFARRVESEVSARVGEPVRYDGELCGRINTEGRVEILPEMKESTL